MLLLFMLCLRIANVYGQCKSGPSYCDTVCTGSEPAEPHYCTDFQGQCTESPNACVACQAVCTLAAGFEDAAFNAACNTVTPCPAAPTPEPTQHPIKPGDPTIAPSVPSAPPTAAPHACGPYQSCCTAGCGTTGCDAPAADYSCDSTDALWAGGSCTDFANECAACCEADAISNNQWLRTPAPSFAVFTQYCSNALCPTPTPTADAHVCQSYTCGSGCAGEPTVEYFCNPPLWNYDCTNLDSECATCCEADTISNNQFLTPALDKYGVFDTHCQTGRCPTVSPTANPSGSPSKNPTDDPSTSPSKVPSGSPIPSPTRPPLTSGETHHPSTSPSRNPSGSPSSDPSASPSGDPSANPSRDPSADPSVSPSRNPSANPSGDPSTKPSDAPTPLPSRSPLRPGQTHPPSQDPSVQPSSAPFKPTASPVTSAPVPTATNPPTKQPTSDPVDSNEGDDDDDDNDDGDDDDDDDEDAMGINGFKKTVGMQDMDNAIFIGIVGGIVVGLIGIVCIIYCVCCKSKNKGDGFSNPNKEDVEMHGGLEKMKSNSAVDDGALNTGRLTIDDNA